MLGTTALGYLPGAWAAAHFRLKSVIVWVWWLTVPCALTYALAPSWPWLIPGVVLAGLYMANNPALKTYILLKSEPSRVSLNMMLVFGGYSIGMIVAPSLGGLLAAHAGMRVVFMVGAAFAACLGDLRKLHPRHALPRRRDDLDARGARPPAEVPPSRGLLLDRLSGHLSSPALPHAVSGPGSPSGLRDLGPLCVAGLTGSCRDGAVVGPRDRQVGSAHRRRRHLGRPAHRGCPPAGSASRRSCGPWPSWPAVLSMPCASARRASWGTFTSGRYRWPGATRSLTPAWAFPWWPAHWWAACSSARTRASLLSPLPAWPPHCLWRLRLCPLPRPDPCQKTACEPPMVDRAA